MASEADVERKLRHIKYLISRGSDYFVFREDLEKNKATLKALGFLPEHAVEILSELEVQDYSKGPEINKSETKVRSVDEEVWVFGKEIVGLVTMEVYVKFSLVDIGSDTSCCCISFHKADFVIEYPFK
ncbi:type II toxin-antitoxin system MqsR family toxin [Neobacillus drentensis]|uniref:type II toxin-antitoxin system MqsR family toxin n=1 Tax=Neobacillus drentensis TaxID=220684 RepID=UPI0008375718|nr:type II toxin-antitoxin system MqsR family toxin [Neobacillus drentensis]